MADALDPDPHGTRGSTVHHALDYKGEVKAFSGADIMAQFRAAQRGEALPQGKPGLPPSAPCPLPSSDDWLLSFMPSAPAQFFARATAISARQLERLVSSPMHPVRHGVGL